jgi:hypothetical protein
MVNNFFYYNSKGKYTICDLEFCAESKNTIDINLFDITNNAKLLNILNLAYISGSYDERARWFCGYLSSFDTTTKEGQYEKSLTNPVVRLLIIDKTMMNNVLNAIKL